VALLDAAVYLSAAFAGLEESRQIKHKGNQYYVSRYADGRITACHDAGLVSPKSYSMVDDDGDGNADRVLVSSLGPRPNAGVMIWSPTLEEQLLFEEIINK
jgi:hypothetical protein